VNKQLSMFDEKEKTLQDFRNEMQEMHYREINRMQRTGETEGSNLFNKLLRKLDDEYGTEYQKTESVVKAQKGATND